MGINISKRGPKKGLLHGMFSNHIPFVVYDKDALRFFSACALSGVIINPLEKFALNIHVLNLKKFGLWQKGIYYYPYLGSSLNSFKYNLFNPKDSNAAYRLTFPVPPSVSSNGVQFNGSNQYAKTWMFEGLEPRLLKNDSNYFGFYSRTNNQTDGVDFGAYDNGKTLMYARMSSGNMRVYQGLLAEAANSSSNGVISTSRIGVNIYAYRDKTTIITSSVGTGNQDTIYDIYIGCLNFSGSPSQYSNRQHASDFCFQYLTKPEHDILVDCETIFHTLLRRNV
jgi:hypothetical protein